jgi:aminomethyltransferase
MTRIEAGFIQTNTDFMAAEDSLRPVRMRSPYEIGMGWLVHLNKESYFVGKRALKKEKETGNSERCLVGLDIDGDKPAVGSVIYNEKKEDIGIVTAAMWSPTMKRNVALASLKRPYGIKIKENIFAEIYHPEELEYKKIWAKCKVVKRQFFSPERRNKVPADLYE